MNVIVLLVVMVFGMSAFAQFDSTAEFARFLDKQLMLISEGKLEVNPGLTRVIENQRVTQIRENQTLEKDLYRKSTGQSYNPYERPDGEAGKRWDKTSDYLKKTNEDLKEAMSVTNVLNNMRSTLDRTLPSVKPSKASLLDDNDIKKINYVIKTAKDGNRDSQHLLGLWYANGTNPVIEQDMEEAAKWFEKAAKQRHQQATVNYGFLLYKGDVVEQDTEQAIKFLKRGIIGRDEEASNDGHYYLGMLYYEEDDMQECIKYLKRASGHRKAQSSYWIGTIYLEGKGDIDQDIAAAVRYFYRAAKDNDKYPGAVQAKSESITILRELANRGVPNARQYLQDLGL